MQLFPLICITFAVAAVYSIQIPPFVLLNRARTLVTVPSVLNNQRIGQDLAMISDRISALENHMTRNALSSDQERGIDEVRSEDHQVQDLIDEVLEKFELDIEEIEAFWAEFLGGEFNAGLMDIFIFLKLFSIHLKLRPLRNEIGDATFLANLVYDAITNTVIPHLTKIKLEQDKILEALYDTKAALGINTLNTNKLVSYQHEQRLFNKYISESVRDVGHTCLRQNPFKSSIKYN